MAAPILSHPFRLRPNGTVATVVQGSDGANSEQIAVLALTRYGERDLQPRFGMSDPTMAGFNPTELAAQLARYGPAVTVTNVVQSFVNTANVSHPSVGNILQVLIEFT